ncbi:ABC transporter substrate-binding protein [Neoroseomonas rubea]|uniref:ABC transporter substrate-binding protein n=1 Tax=Neoroseomonas rubea TaxID=2748666 RepID=UPI0018DFD1C3|nr:ABC transporter substrate-binding protein [Roseomonas rubea]
MIARRGLLGALALPLPAMAQPRRPRRIGYLHAVTIAPENTAMRVFTPLWRRAGFVEEQNLFLRSAQGDGSRLPGLVEELLRLDVSVIMAIGAEVLAACARGTRSVPIVAVDLETDPVAAGLAQSLARPGGNVTGLFLDQPSMAGKWLDLLVEVAPRTRHIVFLWDPSAGPLQLAVAQGLAAQRGLTTEVMNWRQVGDFDRAFAPLDVARTGVVCLTAPGWSSVLPRLGPALLARRLPCVTFLSSYLGGGILLGYGPDQLQFWGLAMPMVERILAGEDPAVMPIERPRRFHFAVDMRVAAALGLSVPATVLAQADEVLE